MPTSLKAKNLPPPPDLVGFKIACRRLGIHPNTGYKLRQEDRFPLEVLEVGDRFFCRRTDLDAYGRHAG